ncbi:hypothetical protein GCM10018965_072090 [Nonomuraea roseola]
MHDAHHTAATLPIERVLNIWMVQESLGHTRVTTTERYTLASTPLMHEAGERLASTLWDQVVAPRSAITTAQKIRGPHPDDG